MEIQDIINIFLLVIDFLSLLVSIISLSFVIKITNNITINNSGGNKNNISKSKIEGDVIGGDKHNK